MEISILLVEQIVQLFLMILLGWVLGRAHIVDRAGSRALSQVVLYGVMPCVTLNAFQKEVTPQAVQGLLFAGAAAVLAHLVMALVTAAGRYIFKLNSMEQCSVFYSNAGNLILPIVGYVLGQEWLLYAFAFIVVQQLVLWTHGKSAMSQSKSFCWQDLVKNVNLIAVAISLLLFVLGIRLPSLISQTATSIGALFAPMSMIVTGVLLSTMDLKQVFGTGRVYLVSALRLLVCPVLTILAMKAIGMAGWVENGSMLLLVVLFATMTPAASTIVQMAQVYDNQPQEASKINVMTTLLCIITMPLMVFLYQYLMG